MGEKVSPGKVGALLGRTVGWSVGDKEGEVVGDVLVPRGCMVGVPVVTT